MRKALSKLGKLGDKLKGKITKDGEDQQPEASSATERKSLDTARTPPDKNTGISGRPEATSSTMAKLLKANEEAMGSKEKAMGEEGKEQIQGYEDRKEATAGMSSKDEQMMQKLTELARKTSEEREGDWQARLEAGKHQQSESARETELFLMETEEAKNRFDQHLQDFSKIKADYLIRLNKQADIIYQSTSSLSWQEGQKKRDELTSLQWGHNENIEEVYERAYETANNFAKKSKDILEKHIQSTSKDPHLERMEKLKREEARLEALIKTPWKQVEKAISQYEAALQGPYNEAVIAIGPIGAYTAYQSLEGVLSNEPQHDPGSDERPEDIIG